MSQIVSTVTRDTSNNDRTMCNQNNLDDANLQLHPQQYSNQQVLNDELRILTEAEATIIKTINNCFKNWFEPWKKTFLADSREFKIIYDLMEGLLHYEYQIKHSLTPLLEDRRNAISQAVARLVDYGNAILNMDLIIRANDETSSELEPNSITTIEMFKAHLKANVLREKLLYDYFKKDKPSVSGDEMASSPTTTVPTVNLTSIVTLQVPSASFQGSNHSPRQDMCHRSSIGSNSSINIIPDGRKTPQHISPSVSQQDLRSNQTAIDLENQIELTHILATIRSSAFSSTLDPATRLAFLPGTLAKIESLLSVPTNIEKISNCFEIVDTLLDTLEKLPVECRSQEVNMVSTVLLKPIVRKVYIEDRDSLVEYQHAHWTAYLICIMKLMQPADFSAYLRSFNNMADLSAFLKDYLFIVKRSMAASDRAVKQSELEYHNSTNPTYPHHWIEMNLLACSTFLASLTYLYQVLRQLFTTNLQMWTSFIECLIQFLLQGALEPSRSMLKERQRLLAADLRQTSAEYVWITWDSLSSDQKQSLLEDLLEPLIRASMTLDSKQRSILLPIFYDMMRCDYTSQYIIPRGSNSNSVSSTVTSLKSLNAPVSQDSFQQSTINTYAPNSIESLPYLSYRDTINEDGTVLTKFTHLVIGKLNTLMIDLGSGDELFRSELCAALSGDLNPKYYNRNLISNSNDIGQFRSMAKHTSDLISEFMQICLDMRQANKLSYKHLYLLCLFKLILFFKDKVDRVELYLTYLYKLCYLHHVAARYVEAGYTLLEHAKSLPWSDKILDSHYRIITRYFQTPHPLNDYSSLKVFLYNTIMEYFDQGQLWEPAIPLCRELIDIYEFKTFEYGKLAQVLGKMSNYFYNIVENSGTRGNPEYFRVTFYGKGFPDAIRNSTMVYRGNPYEKLGDFQSTMLSKYPDAKLLTSLAKPDEQLTNDPEARYLQVNACTPIVDLKARFGTSITTIEDSILNFYRNNQCDKFQFSRRISRPLTSMDNSSPSAKNRVSSDDNFVNMWRERTTLTTNTLPGMLPFFPVYLVEASVVTPIESAIEDLERANDRLSSMVNRFKSDKRHVEDIRPLGQLLLGVVDAAVNGGITKYEEAFFDLSNMTTTNLTSPSSTLTSIESNFEVLNNLHSDELHMNPNNGQHTQQHNNVDKAYAAQVDKLKCLIAKQVPILDEAIRLHRDRVADIMRPQHEHLEASYKKLKHHIMTKYSRHLPSDYSRSTTRSYRSLARSPNRSLRSESRLPLNSSELGIIVGGAGGRFAGKRMSDVGNTNTGALNFETTNESESHNTSKIPYKQMANERRSLPFLTTDQVVVKDIGDSKNEAQKDLPDTEPIQIQDINTIRGSTSMDSSQIRPIPATRTLLSRGEMGRLSRRLNNCDIYEAEPAVNLIAVSKKSQYTRLLHDDDASEDEEDNGREGGTKSSRRLEKKTTQKTLDDVELVKL